MYGCVDLDVTINTAVTTGIFGVLSPYFTAFMYFNHGSSQYSCLGIK